MGVNDWIKQHSELVKISVTTTPWGAFGLVAKDEIKEGEVVAVLRDDGVMDLNRALQQPVLGEVFRSFHEDGFPSHLLLTLFILLFVRVWNER